MTSKVMFRSYFDGVVDEDKGLDCSGDPGYTKQEFKEECDINVIMKKYTQYGVLPGTGDSPGQFGDFTNVPDLLEAQLIVQRAQDDFAGLSADVRDRFANDPVRLMRFLDDDKNRDEAVRLGLVVPAVVAEPVVPIVATPKVADGGVDKPKA